MKKTLLALAAVASLGLGHAQAQTSGESPWLVRLRAVNLYSANNDSTNLGLSVSNITLPELDVSYFFTKNISAELILTVPQQHSVYSTALNKNLGTFSELPPTLLAQYHFNAPGFSPYVGAGVNYTNISNVSLSNGADLTRTSFGGALQVGVDVPLNKNLSFNFDVKQLYISTDVSVNGVKQGSLGVNPLLVGVGFGWRF